MSNLKTVALALAALALTAQIARARQLNSRANDLRGARDRLSQAASRTKGGAQQRILLERQRINNLIDDVESGRSVDPAAIDRALERAQQPTP